MMDCAETRDQIGALRDGELEAERAERVRQHVASCSGCARRSAALDALGDRLKDPSVAYAPSPELVPRIRTAIAWEAREREERGRRVPPVAWLALATAAGIVVGALAVLQRGRAVRSEALAAELAGDQVRSLLPGRLVDVPSSDRHNVKPWFAGKLEFSPPVPDLSPEGFPLVGGRVEVLSGRKAAALVYTRRLHVINVYVCPSANAPGEASSLENGFHIRHWTDGEMSFWAVSDLAASELDPFVALFRARSR
jgi:anti-sigma factor RsiW